MTENYVELAHKIHETISWLMDLQESGEGMIETTGYHHTYFSPWKRISEKDLDIICDSTNKILKDIKFPMRICWITGEIRPVEDEKSILHIDKITDKVFNVVWVPKNAFQDEIRTIAIYSSYELMKEHYPNIIQLEDEEKEGYFYEESTLNEKPNY